MATTAEGRAAPVHLWIVGILALLWNGYACYEYLMTNLKDQAFMARIPADQLAYMDSLPSWLTAFWALGVWGGLAGAILIGLGYQMFIAKMPASMTAGAMAFMPWVIIIVCLFLLWYARGQEKQGALR